MNDGPPTKLLIAKKYLEETTVALSTLTKNEKARQMILMMQRLRGQVLTGAIYYPV